MGVGMKLFILCASFILCIIWTTVIIAVNMERHQVKWENIRYGRLLEKYPSEYSICVECNRPRPHKKMTDDGRGWKCDEHFD